MAALTIIVASQDGPKVLVACLNSLLAQTAVPPIQIIIVDSSLGDTANQLNTTHPHVQLMRQPARTPVAQLHAVGLSHAHSDVVAFTEAVCTFPPDWATAVCQAHDAHEYPAIGGAMAPAPNLRPSDLGLFYVDYGRFLPPFTPLATRDLPGLNLSFKREPLVAAITSGQIEMADLSWKTAVLWQFDVELAAARHPEIQAIYHRRASKGEILRRQWRHGRCFGGQRAANAPPLRRPLIALFGWFLIPTLMKLQFWREVRPKIKTRPDFWLTLPHVARAILAWSAGEWWGNLFGPGRTCAHT